MVKKYEFKELLADTHNALVKLTVSKGEEYADSDDQLANFKRAAEQIGIAPETVWYVYFNKHVDAIRSYIKTGGVKSEPIQGRIDDAILYLILLKGLINDKNLHTKKAGQAINAGPWQPPSDNPRV